MHQISPLMYIAFKIALDNTKSLEPDYQQSALPFGRKTNDNNFLDSILLSSQEQKPF